MAQIAFARSRGSDAPPLLLDAAKAFESHDDRLARETYLEAFGVALFADRLGGRVGIREVQEIGGQAFISPRMVEYHLHKVFAKLGVSSRRELPAAPREMEGPVPP